jgi:RHH-type rel operon transcriptional repressor/antitoxin RelB
MAMVTVRLSDELRARIDNLAERTGRPKSYFVRELIIRGIEEFEEDLRDLEAIREYIAAGGRNQKRYSFDEVLEDAGLTRMDIGMAPSSKKTAGSTTNVSKATDSKKTSASAPKRSSGKSSKATER